VDIAAAAAVEAIKAMPDIITGILPTLSIKLPIL
jgi:hypothetical protein